MVVTDRNGGEIGEKVEHVSPAPCVEDPRSVRLAQVHDDLVSVREHVPREHGVNVRRLNMDTPIRDGGNGHSRYSCGDLTSPLQAISHSKAVDLTSGDTFS
jgi:hypothetical protein